MWPCHGQALRRKLLKRKVFVPWGSNTPFKVLTPQQLQPATPPPDIVVSPWLLVMPHHAGNMVANCFRTSRRETLIESHVADTMLQSCKRSLMHWWMPRTCSIAQNSTGVLWRGW